MDLPLDFAENYEYWLQEYCVLVLLLLRRLNSKSIPS